jgi:hypothetical protein
VERAGIGDPAPDLIDGRRAHPNADGVGRERDSADEDIDSRWPTLASYRLLLTEPSGASYLVVD